MSIESPDMQSLLIARICIISEISWANEDGKFVAEYQNGSLTKELAIRGSVDCWVVLLGAECWLHGVKRNAQPTLFDQMAGRVGHGTFCKRNDLGS